ncbi:MAG: hypothetical protein E7612_02625 [Ruminococcaceae bacterium]|nr:hypothetical protein [Oscillospiraceae bacterium]
MLPKKLAKSITCFFSAIFVFLTVLSLVGCGGDGGSCKYSNEEILVEVANAFERRGSYIQYNQTLSRRHINPSPEDATDQNRVYLDCSSFVNAVYFEAFGVNVLPYPTSEKSPNTKNYRDYSRDNRDAADVVGYWLNSEYATEDVQQALLSEIRASLKVGDVLNYRKGTTGNSGHALLYVGEDQFIHCTGSDYKFNDDAILSCDGEDSKGSISFIHADKLFSDKSSARYLFNNQYDICVVRPFERDLTPTEKTCNRMDIGGVEIEKTVSVGVNSGVGRGEIIEYTIELENHFDKTFSLCVEESLGEKVSVVFASDEIKIDDRELKAEVLLNAGEKVKIKWKVKVDDTAKAGDLIESRATRVNGMIINGTVNTVSGYSQTQLSDLAEKAKSYARSSESFDDPILMARRAYKEVFGEEVFEYNTVSELLADIIDVEGFSLNAESDVYGMVAPYLYGGRDISTAYYRNKELVRLITQDNISVGDIIAASDADGEKTIVYIYAGGDQFIYVKSEEGVAASKYMLQSAGSSTHILVTLFAYDRYVILRPSMAVQDGN